MSWLPSWPLLVIFTVALAVLARETVVQWRLRRYRQAMRLDRGQVFERTEGNRG